MIIKKYDDTHRQEFKKMLITYFNDDMKCNWSSEFIEDKILRLFEEKWSKEILYIDLLEENKQIIGFAIYQIDTPQSDWCKKEGWGFIREVYIQKDYRKQDYGYELVKNIEWCLKSKKVKDIYLNADDAIAFWNKCGYINTNEVNVDGMYILIKKVH